jgi:hypothetical protein
MLAFIQDILGDEVMMFGPRGNRGACVTASVSTRRPSLARPSSQCRQFFSCTFVYASLLVRRRRSASIQPDCVPVTKFTILLAAAETDPGTRG